MGKKSESGSGMNNPHHISEGLKTIFWLKYANSLMWIRVSRMEKIRIRDKHPGSATLVKNVDAKQVSGFLLSAPYHFLKVKKQYNWPNWVCAT
jgi:hypothetical protein